MKIFKVNLHRRYPFVIISIGIPLSLRSLGMTNKRVILREFAKQTTEESL
jgi:hypothetical protein